MVLQLLATAEGAYPADVSRSAIAPTLFKGIASPGFRDSQIYYSAQDRVIRRIEPHARWVRGADECRLLIQKIERSEEHTSELQSLMRISYAVFSLKKKKLKRCRTLYSSISSYLHAHTYHIHT